MHGKCFISEIFIPYMEVKILPCRPTGAEEWQVPLYWIKMCPFLDWKPALSWRECHKKVSIFERLRPWPWCGQCYKKVSKSYLHMVFFFTLAALLFERWFGGPPVGVYNSFLLTIKYVKRSLLTKSPTQIFDFQLAALALKINHSVIHYD